MANELTVNVQTIFASGSAAHNFSVTKSITVTSVPYIDIVQYVGTSEESVSFVDVVPGVVVLQNLHATNYVEVGRTTGVYTAKLQAGEPALFRLDGTTLFLKANTTVVPVKIIAYGAS